ncbi:glycosyltransferase family 2 protein [Cognataquiflexum rubidum]|uniref:glycosyltransferase family 2 protein n=1 Tax=Cognataquiflexum rubidum TaxID=2922273 RepID=UPI001F12FE88|nr:glycosyltransferase family 2 protein [Cognataquiflexum rubidum]MCH6236517.1 glycosyltransferase [Cognataquiflexum rubidum]
MIGLVSILIPNFNKETFIRRTLKSILNQSYTYWECIIVDDGSTDDSWEILKSFETKDNRFKIFKRPDYFKKGANSCRNFALEIASGDYIVWFDSDDLMLENALSNRLALIKGNDFIAFQGLQWDLKSNFGLVINNIGGTNTYFSFLFFFPKWLTPSTIIKKSFLIENNIFWDKDIPFYQDIFYNLSLLSNAKKFEFFQDKPDWIWVDAQESMGKQIKKDHGIASQIIFIGALKIIMDKLNIDPKDQKLVLLKRMYAVFSQMQENGNFLNQEPVNIYLEYMSEKRLLKKIEYFFLKAHLKLGFTSLKKGNLVLKFLFYRIIDWKVSKNVKKYKESFLKDSVLIKDIFSQDFQNNILG